MVVRFWAGNPGKRGQVSQQGFVDVPIVTFCLHEQTLHIMDIIDATTKGSVGARVVTPDKKASFLWHVCCCTVSTRQSFEIIAVQHSC